MSHLNLRQRSNLSFFDDPDYQLPNGSMDHFDYQLPDDEACALCAGGIVVFNIECCFWKIHLDAAYKCAMHIIRNLDDPSGSCVSASGRTKKQ